MRWDRLFEDLEDQLASEWEAERAALESETERLRLSRVTLRERLCALASPAAGADPVSVEQPDGTLVRGHVHAVGVDFSALRLSDTRGSLALVRLDAIVALTVGRDAMLRSARPGAAATRPALLERLTLGFVLRDVARRRQPVWIATTAGRRLSGTVDRVGSDHLDLALHDPGAPRRASAVAGVRIIPFASVASVRLDGEAPALL